MIVGFVLILSAACLTQLCAFIPRICMENATLSCGICCPKLLPNTGECGGHLRGSCQQIRFSGKRSANLTEASQYDDRLNWPLRFFRYLCECKDNYAGIGCEKCKHGWTGTFCKEPAKRKIRKNVLSMSHYEKFIFRSVLNISKYRTSDYVVLNMTSTSNGDPTSRANIQFSNVSIYDLFVYLHFYASRSSMPKTDQCSKEHNLLNFAHWGPAFFTWHRYWNLHMESVLSEIAETEFQFNNFSLPYWNWIGKRHCDVCTADIIGPMSDDPDYQSSFVAKWRPLCRQNPTNHGCHICDPQEEQPFLWRLHSTRVTTLPSLAVVKNLFSIPIYDSPPFTTASKANQSFRNSAEGYSQFDEVTSDGKSIHVYIHNLVHNFINGTWFDSANSPNDPIFVLHHVFMDKIFDLWLQKSINVSMYPISSSVPLGHGAHEFMVPFIPLIRNNEMFISSTSIGYEYDNNHLEDTNILGHNSGVISDSVGTKGVSMVVFTIFLVGSALGILMQYYLRYRIQQNGNVATVAQCTDKSPLLGKLGATKCGA